MKKPRRKSVIPGDQESLTELQERFRSWRKTKAYPRAPIPPQLWNEAVQQAGAHGGAHVCRALGLDYSLKCNAFISVNTHSALAYRGNRVLPRLFVSAEGLSWTLHLSSLLISNRLGCRVDVLFKRPGAGVSHVLPCVLILVRVR